MPPSPTKQTLKPTPVSPPRKTPGGGGGVLSRITNIGFQNTGIKMLIYGKSGTGKTSLWGSFPGPILAVICSGGTKPGELRTLDAPEFHAKVKTVTLEASSELREIVDHIKQTEAFKTIVLDHASGFQDLTLREILGVDELPAQKSWGMASQQQYGQSTLMCKGSFRALLSLDCNVIIIAQERVFGDESNSEITAPNIGAALTPAVTSWLNPACDYVVQTFIRAKMETTTTSIRGKQETSQVRGAGFEFCLRTAPHDVYLTKFRMPKGKVKLPEVIVDPSYEKILKLIKGG